VNSGQLDYHINENNLANIAVRNMLIVKTSPNFDTRKNDDLGYFAEV
jgi:hypothetical protein